MATKREKTTMEMSSLAEQALTVWEYVDKEKSQEVFPFDIGHVKNYWSQSKIDTAIHRLKCLLVEAKAARYDLIAPQYDQLCIDMAEPLREDPVWTESTDIDFTDLPF